jgi:branched-chain amino acid aminotransferase
MTDHQTLTIPTCILTPGGVQPTPYAASSLADAAAKEPDGIYTLARTFKRDQVLLLDDHLNRLEQSAALVGLAINLDRPALRRAIRGLIEQTDYLDSRFRITVPRAIPEAIYLAIEPYKPVPPEILEHGARVATVRMERHNPAAKTTAWMAERKPVTDNMLPDVYEGLLKTDDGVLLEGLSSNFYAVIDGQLRTAGEGVLQGIAQRIVLQIAPTVLPVRLQPITTGDLPFTDEAFITSAGRGVVPVIMVDHQVIANGMPGPMTRAIRDKYEAYANAHMEPL